MKKTRTCFVNFLWKLYISWHVMIYFVLVLVIAYFLFWYSLLFILYVIVYCYKKSAIVTKVNMANKTINNIVQLSHCTQKIIWHHTIECATCTFYRAWKSYFYFSCMSTLYFTTNKVLGMGPINSLDTF